MDRSIILFAFLRAQPSHAQVEYFECNGYPPDAGWELSLAGTFGADWWNEAGILYQAVNQPEGWPGPLGNAEFYRRSIGDFAGEPEFFIEWVVETDATVSILDVHGTPTGLSASGNGNAIYHFTFTDQRVRLFRGATLPEVYVDIAPNVPHTYRLEVFWDELYVAYMDGQLIDSGIPNGPYPIDDSRMVWGCRYYVQELPVQTTRWDYVRYGVIPEDASGDFDSDGLVTLTDFYFLQECLTNDRIGIIGGPHNNSGPGCEFADFNTDGDTDLLDFAEFQNLFSAND